MKRTAQVSRKVRVELSASDLREALDFPSEAEFFVWVPGGGDWSDQRLDVDQESSLFAVWTETTESDEGGEE